MTIDLEQIRQSPRQFCTVEDVEELSDYAMSLEMKLAECQAALASAEELDAACREYAAKVLWYYDSQSGDFKNAADAAYRLRSGEWNPGEVK